LTFDLLTLKWGHKSYVSWAFFLPIFSGGGMNLCVEGWVEIKFMNLCGEGWVEIKFASLGWDE